MSDRDLQALLINRYGALESPVGRFRSNAYSVWKRLSWQAVVSSSEVVKRGFDILFSAIVLLMLAPLFGLVALLIKLEDGGPVFFAQRRVGKFGREFRMFKFRSMCPNAEQKLKELLAKNQHAQGVTFKMKEDPRITRVGRYLRKYSIDEFPQFWNVLRGDMSLVGPRPPLPREVALYSRGDRQRLAVTPGLTCFWQIGGRANIDFPEQVQLDVRYIESQSFWLDLWILLKTIPAVLLGKGAC